MNRLRLKPLAEQVIVITGASSGIGLVTARMAVAAGARVMLVSRDGATLGTIVTELGGRAAYAVADVGDRAAVEAVAQAAIDRFGRIDTWVNVAGVAIYAKLLDTPMSGCSAPTILVSSTARWLPSRVCATRAGRSSRSGRSSAICRRR